MQRLSRPLLKEHGQYSPISFDEAFERIANLGHNAKENEILVMTSGNYTNEEYYLLQRLARTAFHTNAIGSFDYYERGTAFFADKNDIVPFAELYGATLFICAFDDSVQAAPQLAVQQIINSCPDIPQIHLNKPETLNIIDYAAFFRALNYHLIYNNLAKGIYIQGLGKNYATYKKNLLIDDYAKLLDANHLTDNEIHDFIVQILNNKAPVFLIWERFLSARAVTELENLCMLLDIQAKPSSGFLCIKAELNSQGLFDMGIFPEVCVGGRPFTAEMIQMMEQLYKQPVCTSSTNIVNGIHTQSFRSCVIMNNVNIPLPREIVKFLSDCPFKVLQTAYSDNVQELGYDMIIPSNIPEEASGSYTDFTRTPHNSKPLAKCEPSLNSLFQLSTISERCGLPKLDNPEVVFLEYISFFRGGCQSENRHFFR